ncbi:polymerase delta-interacting protein 3 [Polypterus senegalus]|uniref:polymerase delta-interacting protein 3 n=1 Tax=Polypterus senegalus TaxID=55291 RepID=UPI0019665D0B|nr:polymerase delta-interacting protein 3 [Polypterus senegalus]
MADLSLDELIRQRGFNHKGNNRMLMRGGGGGPGGIRSRIGPPIKQSIGGASLLMQRGGTFDARQKIGVTDARLRLSSGMVSAGGIPIKDAREKIGQKDARFRIRGKVQDARETINSRKQQSQNQMQHQDGLITGSNSTDQLGGVKKLLDARERLSLKRSIPITTPTMGSANSAATSTMKITKTIQGLSQDEGTDGIIPNKQMKITTSNNFAQKLSTSGGSRFSLSSTVPLTKVVQNDAYTAPSPAVPVGSAPAAKPQQQQQQQQQSFSTVQAKTLSGVSRTLVTQQTTAVETPTEQTPTQQPAFSPLEGTKMTVNNLHPRVTEEDIVELFCVCGALKRARLVKAGMAEVVFVKKEDAIAAYKKYNNRCLDGQPMKCNLHIQGNVITSEQPILLRLSDSPGQKKDPASLQRNSNPRPPTQPQAEVDPDTILKALFKSSGPSTVITQATAFRIKI